MPISGARKCVNDYLAGLDHTGAKGFEGLITILCESASGQRFRLSSSGAQHGQDSASESGYGNRIKVETKHYQKTSLNTRELLGEIDQAAHGAQVFDLWVLAASCRVPSQLEEELDRSLSARGVDLLILDSGVDELPRIAVLIAKFPEVVREWSTTHQVPADWESLGPALTEIQHNSGFLSAWDQLQWKLKSTLLGFEDARRRVNAHFLNTLTDTGDCRAVFGQRIDVCSAGAATIRRSSVHANLNQWWAENRLARGNCVVIGEEGSGKTWATFDWLAERIRRDHLGMVLAISASAQQDLSAGQELSSFVAELLARRTKIGDECSWRIKLDRWLEAPVQKEPIILFVIDGLNERSSIEWAQFLRGASSKSWRNHIAVLVTDRPTHWKLKCAEKGLADFKEIEVGGYSDRELELMLLNTGVPAADIPNELQTLIRTPRYCGVVCENFEDLKADGDFTIERLLFLEARSRSSRSAKSLGQSEFNEIIRDLARHYKENPSIDRQGLRNLVSWIGDDNDIYLEIETGGMLIPQPGRPGRFQVEPKRLIYGLGILLAEEVSDWYSRATSVRSSMSGFGPGLNRSRRWTKRWRSLAVRCSMPASMHITLRCPARRCSDTGFVSETGTIGLNPPLLTTYCASAETSSPKLSVYGLKATITAPPRNYLQEPS